MRSPEPSWETVNLTGTGPLADDGSTSPRSRISEPTGCNVPDTMASAPLIDEVRPSTRTTVTESGGFQKSFAWRVRNRRARSRASVSTAVVSSGPEMATRNSSTRFAADEASSGSGGRPFSPPTGS